MSLLGDSREITETDLNKVKVVPNPYIVNSAYNETASSNRIRFTHLPQQCKISIYTISGELVDEINHGSADNFSSDGFWDLRNAHGRKVAPGLYIFRIETTNGKTN